ncbi:MAG: SDR family NAD(P)-dependent oxidoreductase [Deltaproteobacteria bacterium]|nr:SDR family NAD(P)-dependent oxidoreductase [Deltaproteobacteria bacterium]
MTTSQGPLVLVTGSTDGIGRETARELCRRGARVILHGRSAERLERTRAELTVHASTALPAPLTGDLSSLAGVRALAEALLARGEPLDVLVNNAGVYLTDRRLTVDGFELTMAVNHFAPFLLTHLLLPALEGSGHGRVVHVSSVAHTRGELDLADLTFARRFSGYAAYAASKLANVLFSVELARRLASRPVTTNALHPGVVSTKLLKAGFGMEGPDSLAEGAATSVYLALSPEVAEVTGRYFVKRRQAPAAPAASDVALCRAFYEESARLTGASPL